MRRLIMPLLSIGLAIMALTSFLLIFKFTEDTCRPLQGMSQLKIKEKGVQTDYKSYILSIYWDELALLEASIAKAYLTHYFFDSNPLNLLIKGDFEENIGLKLSIAYPDVKPQSIPKTITFSICFPDLRLFSSCSYPGPSRYSCLFVSLTLGSDMTILQNQLEGKILNTPMPCDIKLLSDYYN